VAKASSTGLPGTGWWRPGARGPIVSRFGARRVVIIGGLWSAGVLAAFPLVDSLAMLYVLSALLGLTYAMCTAVMASILVSTWFATRRGTVQGIVMSFSGVGGIILGLVMPAAITAWGWEGGFRLLAVYVALTVVLPGVVLIRSTPASAGLLPYGAKEAAAASTASDPVQAPTGAVRAAVRSPQFLAILLVMVLINGLTTFQQHLPLILATDGIAPAAAGTLVSALALSMLVAKLVVGVLDDVRGTITAMWTALTLFACGLFVLAAGSIGLAVMMPLWGLAYDRTGSFTLPLVIAGVVTLLLALALHWALASAAGAVPPPEDSAGDVEGAAGDRNGADGLQPVDGLARG